MKVVTDRPPNYDLIIRRFPAVRQMTGVLYTYGDEIYNPDGVAISASLQAHEEIHSQRQLEQGVNVWWGEYLTDTKFRLEEELVAHQKEFEVVCAIGGDRRRRQFALKYMARRLSSPMYGHMVSFKKAKKLIKQPTHSLS